MTNSANVFVLDPDSQTASGKERGVFLHAPHGMPALVEATRAALKAARAAGHLHDPARLAGALVAQLVAAGSVGVGLGPSRANVPVLRVCCATQTVGVTTPAATGLHPCAPTWSMSSFITPPRPSAAWDRAAP